MVKAGVVPGPTLLLWTYEVVFGASSHWIVVWVVDLSAQTDMRGTGLSLVGYDISSSVAICSDVIHGTVYVRPALRYLQYGRVLKGPCRYVM